MAHRINGFIGKLEPLRDAAASLPEHRVVPLTSGFGFLPVIEKLKEPPDPGPFPDLRLLGRYASWAVQKSHAFPLAYIETEYWAGPGTQSAVVWRSGGVVLGPVTTSSEMEHRPDPPDRAINRAVRELGVTRGEAFDEFDSLGLGHHRSNHSWLTEADT